MRILLAVDGSKCSDAAVEYVARQPWPAGSEVKVLSVAEIPYFPNTEFGTLPQQYFEELEKSARDRAQGVVEKAEAALRAGVVPGLPVTAVVIDDAPREAIVKIAGDWPADLIVLGSHGYRGYKRFFLGSVSQSVAAHAPCSVLIVKSPELPE